MNSETELNSLSPEDVEFTTLRANILAQLCKDTSHGDTPSEYRDLAQQQARSSILFSVLDEIIKAGYPPEELLSGIAQYSYRWRCNEATINIENAFTALSIFLQQKAEAQTTHESTKS